MTISNQQIADKIDTVVYQLEGAMDYQGAELSGAIAHLNRLKEDVLN